MITPISDSLKYRVFSIPNPMWIGPTQLKHENLLINFGMCVECILFDIDGVIIDGFATHRDNPDFLYRGKSFYELLGGVSGLANPIDKSLYINEVGIPHPFDIESDKWIVPSFASRRRKHLERQDANL